MMPQYIANKEQYTCEIIIVVFKRETMSPKLSAYMDKAE